VQSPQLVLREEVDLKKLLKKKVLRVRHPVDILGSITRPKLGPDRGNEGSYIVIDDSRTIYYHH
jgi:hypothetical protein